MQLEIWRYILGYFISIFGGALFLWIVIDKIAWTYLTKYGSKSKLHEKTTLYLGIIERLIYTSVFIIDQPAFIAIWLALKVASQWKRWQDEPGTYNVFLIGNALSLIIAFIGAWIALDHVPLMDVVEITDLGN